MEKSVIKRSEAGHSLRLGLRRNYGKTGKTFNGSVGKLRRILSSSHKVERERQIVLVDMPKTLGYIEKTRVIRHKDEQRWEIRRRD